MNLPLAILIAAALLLLLALAYRRRAGFGYGQSVSHDNMTLRSDQYHLVGRPDRIVQRGKHFIAEDKKSSTRLHDSNRVQMGVYMILIEEHFGIRPPHAVVVLRDGQREKIRNTSKLRRQVFDIAKRIRTARRKDAMPLLVSTFPAKCRACAQRRNCRQRAA